jgi:hypothetical protein
MLMPTLSNFRAIGIYQVWDKIQLIMRSQVVAAACEWKETIHSAEKIRSSDSRQSSVVEVTGVDTVDSQLVTQRHPGDSEDTRRLNLVA